MKIHLLDLCCCAGGAAMGYMQAAKELGLKMTITGIDCKPQPNYPFEFIQADAVEFLKAHRRSFTHVHASPPCQSYSRTKSLHTNEHPDLVAVVREALIAAGLPYVIENVPGAPLLNPIKLNGPMFGLRVIRDRLFESNIELIPPPKGRKMGTVGGKNYNRANPGYYYIVGGHQTGTLDEWRAAMGIDWMTKYELAQAVPPAYTKHIGKQFLSLDI